MIDIADDTVVTLTMPGASSIVPYQAARGAFQMHSNEQELKVLEHRLDELIQLTQRLRDENRALRAKQSQLMLERAQLAEKNDLARSRVESMITRLKTMESPT